MNFVSKNAKEPQADANKDCRGCIFCASDPEELYCAHPTSMTTARPFGLSINAARRQGSFCGPEAKKFEGNKKNDPKVLPKMTDADSALGSW
jgi:hypothetical protein